MGKSKTGKGVRKWGGGRSYGLNRVLREGLTEKVTVEQRGEKSGASPGEMWGPGSRLCRGPEVGM